MLLKYANGSGHTYTSCLQEMHILQGFVVMNANTEVKVTNQWKNTQKNWSSKRKKRQGMEAAERKARIKTKACTEWGGNI